MDSSCLSYWSFFRGKAQPTEEWHKLQKLIWFNDFGLPNKTGVIVDAHPGWENLQLDGCEEWKLAPTGDLLSSQPMGWLFSLNKPCQLEQLSCIESVISFRSFCCTIWQIDNIGVRVPVLPFFHVGIWTRQWVGNHSCQICKIGFLHSHNDIFQIVNPVLQMSYTKHTCQFIWFDSAFT